MEPDTNTTQSQDNSELNKPIAKQEDDVEAEDNQLPAYEKKDAPWEYAVSRIMHYFCSEANIEYVLTCYS